MDKNKLIKLANKFSGTYSDEIPSDFYRELKRMSDYHNIFDSYNPIDTVILCFLVSEINRGNTDLENTYDQIKNNLYSFCIGEITEEDVMNECEFCSGYGTQKCSSCDGGHDITCHECGGDGEIYCDECGGSGEDDEDNSCDNCGGEGKDTCSTCDGTGYVDCPDCNGNGREDCEYCEGSGEMNMDDYLEVEQMIYLSWDKDNQFSNLEIKSDLDKFENEGYLKIVNNPKNILIWGDNIKTDMLDKDDFTKGDIFLIDFTTNPLLKNKGGNRGIIDINSTIL
jgi:hypothetical protein